MLRSLADELDAVAAAVVQDRQTTTLSTTMKGYEPDLRPIEDISASDLSIAVPDGHVDATYNCNPEPGSRINVPASVHMARREAQEGKIVKLDFGPRGTYFLTKENWNAELPIT